MKSTTPSGAAGTITARPGGYVAVHPNGHTSHGPMPTKADAVAALDHLAQHGMWPEQVAA